MRKEHEEYIREKREEALQAQELVKEYVTKRVKDEESKNGQSLLLCCREVYRADSLLSRVGLIIDEAVYGVLESIDEKVESELEQRWFNVTGESCFDVRRVLYHADFRLIASFQSPYKHSYHLNLPNL